MGISNKLKFFALVVVVGALAITPIALAAGLTVKTTPAHPKKGQMVQMKVSGLKAGEKVKAVLTLTASGQKAVYFPKEKASGGGVFINPARARVRGKNVGSYAGRRSHKTGS